MATQQTNQLALDHAGYEFIKQQEGSRNTLYNDPSGHCTVGIGHLVHQGNCNGSDSEKEFLPGLSDTQVEALFLRDIQKYEDAVNKAVKVTLTQNQFNALVSFTFNEGTGAAAVLVGDTLNVGKLDQMCSDMVSGWTRSGSNKKMLLNLAKQKSYSFVLVHWSLHRPRLLRPFRRRRLERPPAKQRRPRAPPQTHTELCVAGAPSR